MLSALINPACCNTSGYRSYITRWNGYFLNRLITAATQGAKGGIVTTTTAEGLLQKRTYKPVWIENPSQVNSRVRRLDRLYEIERIILTPDRTLRRRISFDPVIYRISSLAFS